MKYTYRKAVLEQLIRHGIAPDDSTSPEFIRAFLNDLYVYEIRSLRNRLLAGHIPRSDYSEHVRQLRDRYPVLGLPVQFWTED